jgi:hypothetical protein
MIKKADKLLIYIATIGYANPLNMTILTKRTAKNTETALKEVYRLMKQLLKTEMVEPIPDKYGIKDYDRERFFKLSTKGEHYLKAISPLFVYKSLDTSIIWHDTAVIDFCTAIYLAYQDDFIVEFKREHFKDKDMRKSYNPDRVIVLTHKKTCQQIAFMYEHETGTRSTNEIWRLKIEDMKKAVNAVSKEYSNWKFLMTISHPLLKAIYRPWEFTPQLKQYNYDSLILFRGKCRDEKLDSRFIIRPFCDYPDIKSMKLIS